MAVLDRLSVEFGRVGGFDLDIDYLLPLSAPLTVCLEHFRISQRQVRHLLVRQREGEFNYYRPLDLQQMPRLDQYYINDLRALYVDFLL